MPVESGQFPLSGSHIFLRYKFSAIFANRFGNFAAEGFMSIVDIKAMHQTISRIDIREYDCTFYFN